MRGMEWFRKEQCNQVASPFNSTVLNVNTGFCSTHDQWTEMHYEGKFRYAEKQVLMTGKLKLCAKLQQIKILNSIVQLGINNLIDIFAGTISIESQVS